MTRARSALALSLGGLAVLLSLVSIQLIALNHLKHPANALYPLSFLVFAVVGSFIAAKRPGNAIGWLFCLAGLSNIVSDAAQQYAVFVLRTHPGAPAGTFMFWLGMGWVASIGWATMALVLPLLFPTGRLLSPRWRVVAALGLIAATVQVVLQAFTTGSDTVPYLTSMQNPYAIPAVQAIMSAVSGVGQLVEILVMAACVASLVLRFRRAGPEERLQIKWFAYGAVVLAVMISASALNGATVHNGLLNRLGDPLFLVGVSALPLTAAVAIMRYRLYDIDVVINRTLVYGSLTLSLAAVYFGGVVGLQSLFRAVTGQTSDVVVAIVTLAVAAVFNPWRRRLQSFIDRRFYRRKYDASRTLATFSTRLRDDVDLDHLSRDLAGLIHETMEPSLVLLWLRDPAQGAAE
jgi:hypothetical protein